MIFKKIVFVNFLELLNISKLCQNTKLRKKYPYLEFFWSVFSRIRTEDEEILRISPYSVQIRENTD